MRLLRILAALALLRLAAPPARAEAFPARPSQMDLLLRGGVGGGLVGSAVAGGMVAYNLGVQGHAGYDWGRALAWGAGIGVGAGLVLGMIAARTGGGGAPRRPVRDGLSRSLDIRARDQSNSHLFPVLARRF